MMLNNISEILKSFNINLSLVEQKEGIVVGNLILIEQSQNHIAGKETFRIGLLKSDALLVGDYVIDEKTQVMECEDEDRALNGVIIMVIGKLVSDQVRFIKARKNIDLSTLTPSLREKYENIQETQKKSIISH